MYPQTTFNTEHRHGRQISAYERNPNRQRTGDYNVPIQPTVVNDIPTLNGVDITNIGRYFTSEEMIALGSSDQ